MKLSTFLKITPLLAGATLPFIPLYGSVSGEGPDSSSSGKSSSTTANSTSSTSSTSSSALPPILGTEQYGSRILLLDSGCEDWDTPQALLWNWHPVFDTDGLPAQCIPWFGGITDAKPVLNMTHLLVTGSSGAVTLIRMKDKKTIFCVYSRGCHSAELLPDGNVVSAASGADGKLELFDLSTYDPLHPETVRHVSYPLPDIHGTVWDYEQNCLWVDDADGISRWEYERKPFPALKMTALYPVEKNRKFWGHDLFPVPGTKKLFLTGRSIVLFDTVSKTYTPYSRVVCKSISQAFPGGPVIVAIPREQWWTDTVSLLEEDGKLQNFRTRKNMRFYKFRFFTHNEFSYGPLQRGGDHKTESGKASAGN